MSVFQLSSLFFLFSCLSSGYHSCPTCSHVFSFDSHVCLFLGHLYPSCSHICLPGFMSVFLALISVLQLSCQSFLFSCLSLGSHVCPSSCHFCLPALMSVLPVLLSVFRFLYQSLLLSCLFPALTFVLALMSIFQLSCMFFLLVCLSSSSHVSSYPDPLKASNQISDKMGLEARFVWESFLVRSRIYELTGYLTRDIIEVSKVVRIRR